MFSSSLIVCLLIFCSAFTALADLSISDKEVLAEREIIKGKIQKKLSTEMLKHKEKDIKYGLEKFKNALREESNYDLKLEKEKRKKLLFNIFSNLLHLAPTNNKLKKYLI